MLGRFVSLPRTAGRLSSPTLYSAHEQRTDPAPYLLRLSGVN